VSTRVVTLVVAVSALGLVLWAFAVDGIRTIDRYRVPSESMKPGIDVGTHVGLNTRAFHGDAHPEIGDIVIANPPEGATGNECATPPPVGQMCARPKGDPYPVKFIKRVVAGPGDRVAMRSDGTIIRNGKPLREPYVAACEPTDACDFPAEITIPADHYVILGDNRGASDDSRFWGPVHEDWILGRVEDCTLMFALCSPRR
jgi:signal peptidase I